MAKKSERSLLLLCMLFAFACLLLSGGGRLIGSEEENNLIPQRQLASVRTYFCDVPNQRIQTGAVIRQSSLCRRVPVSTAPDRQVLNHSVSSDANGNVLAGQTYMRAVYQVFALDDGFV